MFVEEDVRMSTPLLEGRGLGKAFRVGSSQLTVLQNFCISICQAETVAIVGPSGTGKSTLLHILSGLEQPDQGQVLFEGVNLYALGDIRRSLLRARSFGFIFQAYNLIGSMTALENVEIPLRLTNVRRAADKAREMLQRVGLAERMHHRPGQLSGGEQQRVAVARALAQSPRVVFADEPTGNLDYHAGRAVIDLIMRLVQEQRSACLLVTHNLEWTEVSDRVIDLRSKGQAAAQE